MCFYQKKQKKERRKRRGYEEQISITPRYSTEFQKNKALNDTLQHNMLSNRERKTLLHEGGLMQWYEEREQQSNNTIPYIQENSPDMYSNLVGYGSNSAGAKLWSQEINNAQNTLQKQLYSIMKYL